MAKASSRAIKAAAKAVGTLCALAALSFGAMPAMAQSADANSQAELLLDINLQKTDDLDFSRIVPSGTGGVVTIDAATGAVSTAGSVTTVGTAQQRARFTTNAPIGTIIIFSGDPNVTLTRQSGTETMTATLEYVGGAGFVTTNVFGLPIGNQATATTQEILVGGALTVSGTQAPGTYEGTFTLMVAHL